MIEPKAMTPTDHLINLLDLKDEHQVALAIPASLATVTSANLTMNSVKKWDPFVAHVMWEYLESVHEDSVDPVIDIIIERLPLIIAWIPKLGRFLRFCRSEIPSRRIMAIRAIGAAPCHLAEHSLITLIDGSESSPYAALHACNHGVSHIKNTLSANWRNGAFEGMWFDDIPVRVALANVGESDCMNWLRSRIECLRTSPEREKHLLVQSLRSLCQFREVTDERYLLLESWIRSAK